MSLASPLNDVVKHAELTSEHLQRLERLGGLERNGTDLFGEIKQVREGRGGEGRRGEGRGGEGRGNVDGVNTGYVFRGEGWDLRRGGRGIEPARAAKAEESVLYLHC